MLESNTPKYIFNGHGNYGSENPSVEEWRRAFEETAPACHHSAGKLSSVAFESLDQEMQIAVEANRAANELDADWSAWNIDQT